MGMKTQTCIQYVLQTKFFNTCVYMSICIAIWTKLISQVWKLCNTWNKCDNEKDGSTLVCNCNRLMKRILQTATNDSKFHEGVVVVNNLKTLSNVNIWIYNDPFQNVIFTVGNSERDTCDIKWMQHHYMPW